MNMIRFYIVFNIPDTILSLIGKFFDIIYRIIWFIIHKEYYKAMRPLFLRMLHLRASKPPRKASLITKSGSLAMVEISFKSSLPEGGAIGSTKNLERK